MDLDDLEEPTEVPTRTSRFLPKSSKFKPKPNQILKKEPVSESEPGAPHLKKKENDSQGSVPFISGVAQELPFSSTSNGAVKMEVEVDPKPEDVDLQEDGMDVDGEDRVVREIDVFFTPPPMDNNIQLYVLQYPLRPCWRPYELDERCEEVRVKPESAEVEVDLSVDNDSKNYDQDAPDRLRINKQTLSSSWKPRRSSGYAVGVLTGDKLHLNPIHAVVQLRPSMEHLKTDVSEKKNDVMSNLEVPNKTEVSNKGESIRLTKEQAWIPLVYHDAKSGLSTRYRQRLVTQDTSPIQFSVNPYDYVTSLCPEAVNNDFKSAVPSRRFLLSLPLEERLKTWLCKGASLHRFSTLKHIAPDNSIEDVLRVLRQHANLVQGLWVPKSSLLYQGAEGVQVLARDYILLLFSKSPIITRSQLPFRGALDKAMKEILPLLAVERCSFNDWKLKEPTDTSFLKLYPNVVQDHAQVWEGLEKKLSGLTQKGGKGEPPVKSLATKNPSVPNKLTASNNSDKGPTRAPNGRMTMSDETREALPKALQKLFQIHKVCSFKLICQGLRDMAVSKSTLPKGDARAVIAAAYGADAPQEELQAIISQIAINIHGAYVLKLSTDHPPEYNAFRKVVIDLFCAKEPNAKLRKADIIEAAKIALNREVGNIEYQKVLTELCVAKGSVWMLKSGDGSARCL